MTWAMQVSCSRDLASTSKPTACTTTLAPWAVSSLATSHGSLAVGDEHDGARTGLRERGGGSAQGGADRGVAAGLDAVDGRGEGGLVDGVRWAEDLDVLAALGLLGVGRAGAGAVDGEAHLRFRGSRPDEPAQRALRGVHLGAGGVRLLHRAGPVEDEHDRRVGGLLCSGLGWDLRVGWGEPDGQQTRDGPREELGKPEHDPPSV
nr:hypothetical protein [Amycolatopsis methanolica]